MYPLVHSPTQTTLKSKWNTFKEWLVPDILLLVQKRRPSQCSTTSTTTTLSTSSTNSCCCHNKEQVALSRSTSLLHKKTKSYFNTSRRPSDGSCSSAVTTATTNEQIEKLYDLYNLAMDEINYAQDSRGSPYYHGDRIAAKDAIENCLLYYQALDPACLLGTNTSRIIAFKVATLNSKFDALPLQDDDQRSI